LGDAEKNAASFSVCHNQNTKNSWPDEQALSFLPSALSLKLSALSFVPY
jgi:hypothetical protein